MFLKRLELQGFKSFADKTLLNLDGRVISVVGPNGSGKSNVTDALRWILGERDAKNLRSSRAEDLIFAGTQTKPRAGLAQVTLCFDNTTGFFPVDYSEVSVSRRVSRDGTTQVFLNKSEVRLKDIIDFFAKSRLGARGLTTVNQGESDIFIRSLPLERRVMIEEILGLKEFRIRKAEAERKLKNSETNIEKAAALIEEIKPHLNFLRRQVNRYNNREEILRSLNDLENKFYGNQIKSISAEIRKIETEAQSVENEISRKKSEEKSAGDELEKVKSSEPEAAESLKRVREEKNRLLLKKGDLQRDLGRLEAKLELAIDKTNGIDSEFLSETLDKIRELVREAIEETDVLRIKTVLAKIAELLRQSGKDGGKKTPDINAEKSRLADEAEELEKEIGNLTLAEDNLNAGIRDFNDRFSKAFTNLEGKKRETESFIQRLNHLLLEKEKLDFRLREINREVSESGRDPLTINTSVDELAENERENAKRQIMRFRQELASIGDVDQGTLKEAEETESRYGFLTSQTEDLSKSIADLKTLIADLDGKIHDNFVSAFKSISEEFDKFIKIMFDGGNGKLVLEKADAVPQENGPEENAQKVRGVEIEISLPKKRIKNLEVLSGGEKSLVSIAALFALVSVSPPPFLVLDEIDATLDERNARRLGEMIKRFATKTQFIIVTHNRAVMEVADILYGVTMTPDGTSRILSLKLSPEGDIPEVIGTDVHKSL